MYKHSNNFYLDACSTTPPLKSVIEAISDVENRLWANPSSIHDLGIEAAELLEKSRTLIADNLLVNPNQVHFTSGASESSFIALNALSSLHSPGRIVISSVEHPSVIRAANYLRQQGWEIKMWNVDKTGLINLSELDEMLSPPTKILSLIWGQSEIGTIQPVIKIAKECYKRNILIHTDATQILPHGHFDFNKLNVSSLSASAHKFRGPKGIGLLILDINISDVHRYNQQKTNIEYLLGGTQSVALAYAMSIAYNDIKEKLIFKDDDILFPKTPTKELTSKLKYDLLSIKGILPTGHNTKRLPNHISLIVRSKNHLPISSTRIVKELSNIGIYTSNGSACNSLNRNGSHVLKAIGIDQTLLKSGLRISLGNWISDLDTKSITMKLSTIIENIFN